MLQYTCTDTRKTRLFGKFPDIFCTTLKEMGGFHTEKSLQI